MRVIEIFRGMGKNFKVCRYAFYLFESYKQIKCARSIYYTLLPTSTYIGLIMETGAWPANQRIQYSMMMLYHNMNSDHKKVARKIKAEQAKSNHKNTMILKVKQIAQEIGLKIKIVKNIENLNGKSR